MQDLNRESLEELTGDRVWDTKELQEDFVVRQFAAPFVVVMRKVDKVIGSLEFQHSPRFYFSFEPTQEKVSN